MRSSSISSRIIKNKSRLRAPVMAKHSTGKAKYLLIQRFLLRQRIAGIILVKNEKGRFHFVIELPVFL